MKKTTSVLLPLGVLLCLLCAAIYFSDLFQAYRFVAFCVSFGLALIVFFISLLRERAQKKADQKRMDDVFSENSEVAAHLVNQVSIP